MTSGSCRDHWVANRPRPVFLKDGVKIQTLKRLSKSFLISGQITSVKARINDFNECVLEMREVGRNNSSGLQFFAFIKVCFLTVKPEVGDRIAFMNPDIVLNHEFKSKDPSYRLLCSNECPKCGYLYYFKGKKITRQPRVKLHDSNKVYLSPVSADKTLSESFGATSLGGRNDQKLSQFVKDYFSSASNSNQVSKKCKPTIDVKHKAIQNLKSQKCSLQSPDKSRPTINFVNSKRPLESSKNHEIENIKQQTICPSSVGTSSEDRDQHEEVNNLVKGSFIVKSKGSFIVKSFMPMMDHLDWVIGRCDLCKEVFMWSKLIQCLTEFPELSCLDCHKKGVKSQLEIGFYIALLVCNTASGEQFKMVIENENAEQFLGCTVEEFLSSGRLQVVKFNMLKQYCESNKPVVSFVFIKQNNAQL